MMQLQCEYYIIIIIIIIFVVVIVILLLFWLADGMWMTMESQVH